MFQFFYKRSHVRAYEFTHNIWRVLTDEKGGWFVVELRDREDQKAVFAAIGKDQKGGKPPVHALDENWWLGVEGLWDGFVYFHRYDEPGMPFHSGVYAHKLPDFEKIWEMPAGRMRGMSERGIVYETEGKDGYSILDYTSGKMIGEADGEIISGIQKFTTHRLSAHGHASHLVPNAPGYAEALAALDKKPAEVKGPIDLLEWQDFSVTTHYAPTTGKKLHQILEIRKGGKLKLSEVLQEGIEKYSLDTFTRVNDLLLCLKGRRALWLVELR